MTTQQLRQELGELTDLEAVAQLVPIEGCNLIDAGCGAGHLARGLAGLGAVVLGVEPDPAQAHQNRFAEPVDNVTLVKAGAEALPAEDGSVDGVLFCRSLHHVPKALMDQALKEAARVIKPDGFVVVIEPGMEGSHYRMMRPFHDETEVRTLAQQALDTTARTLFEDEQKYVYMQHPRHESFEAMKDFFTSLSFNDISRDMIDVPEVRENFEAARTDDGYVFDQPTLVNVYRKPRTEP